MLILLIIFLFFFTAFAMFILHLVRPRLSIQGFLAVVAVLLGLVMVLLSHSNIPASMVLLQWAPQSLFPNQPALILDEISWYFAFTLISLVCTVVIISIARIGQSSKLDNLPFNASIAGGETSSEVIQGTQIGSGFMPNWLFWVSALVLTGAGLLAVTSGNVLTLLLAWAALDIIQLVILLGQTLQSSARERVIIIFSIRLAGIVTVLFAGLILWAQGTTLQLNSISPSISAILILAAGIRLGIFPPQQFYTRGLHIRSDLETVIGMVSAASSFILLVRVSASGVAPSITPLLIGIVALVGVFTAFNWLSAKDELEGRSYWLIATSSLAIAAASVGSTTACLVWSIASLISGGLIFSFSLRNRRFIPLILLAVFNLSTLPFSPSWQGTALYQSISIAIRNRAQFFIFTISFLAIQTVLLSGYIRHLLRGVQSETDEKSQHIERWVWVLYPLGVVLLVLAHLLLGWFLLPNVRDLPIVAWLIGPLTLLVAALILFISWRYPRPFPRLNRITNASLSNRLFSLEWLYNFIWQAYRTLSRVITLFSIILEGDGGILWALVLFALIFVFLQR
jgi:formate hydrogenlyase subunit 3/multisubunit Na+/H+ antiporter MnhD subunit